MAEPTTAGRDFLLEIGTEELPASACRSVLELLPDRAAGLFAAENLELAENSLTVLVSPRRIALLIEGLPETQAPRETAQRGPAAAAAFDAEGRPTKAAQGFARARGVTVEELEVREENGREHVFAVSRAEGRPTEELLPGLCARLVREMYFPKNMKWGADLRFSRPVRWLVALYGDEVVPFEAAGLRAGRKSRGHRWLGREIDIPEPSRYVDTMREVKVLVDQREREYQIRSGLENLSAAHGLEAVDPMNKLAEVLYLVEWPTVLGGRFGEDHLRLPDEVLITAMQSHQRYFPLVSAEGGLDHRFLFVSNGDPDCAGTIVAGNERVLEGRIEDAEFSFDKDLATGIEAMAGQLDRVVFHEKVGTMKDKTERLTTLVGYLGAAVGLEGEKIERALEAARLSKADQTSVMIREFADLEGNMGETYARLEGLHEEVAVAIREQYLPEQAGGVAPKTVAGALLATAEKVDNVVAAFAVGEPPSGSKDPYGLRRAAMGMVTIAFYHSLVYDVRSLVEAAFDQLAEFPGLEPRDTVVPLATDFILERLARFLLDNEVSRSAIDAVLPLSSVFQDVRRRAMALDAFRASDAWEDLVTVHTRASNLARKLEPGQEGQVSRDLFEEQAERELYQAYLQASSAVAELIDKQDYYDALERLAGLRPAVDRFFDDVLVMAKDEATRVNRLRLLAAIAELEARVALVDRVQA